MSGIPKSNPALAQAEAAKPPLEGETVWLILYCGESTKGRHPFLMAVFSLDSLRVTTRLKTRAPRLFAALSSSQTK